MLIHEKHDNRMRFIAAGLAMLFIAMTGCFYAGGKGVDSHESRRYSPESRGMSEAESLSGDTGSAERMRTMPATSSDPFGLMPVDWPRDVGLHPESRLAYSGEFGTGGMYLVTIAPSDIATSPGMQTYHLESLAGWESLQVSEEPSDSDRQTDALVILAERKGAWLRIVTERAVPGFIETLPNSDHWLEEVGSEPIVVRMYFMALPDE